mgnify:FL=1
MDGVVVVEYKDEEAAAFNSVFSGEAVGSEESHDHELDENSNQDDEQEVKQDKEDDKATETPPKVEADPVADLRKRLDDVNGRYGRLAQRFEELQSKIANDASTTKAEVDSAKQESEHILKVFEEDGYDDLGKTMAKVLSNRLPDIGAEVDQRVNSVLSQREWKDKADRMNALTEYHPDWMEARETPEFKTWVSELPERVRRRFVASEDPAYVADKLDEFKDWKKAKEQPPENSEQQPVNDGQQRQRRVERAVQPDGQRAAPKRTEAMDEEAAFNAVFKNRNKP